jgi:hypothetical protein
MKPIRRIALVVFILGGMFTGLCHALPPVTARLGLVFDETAASLGRLAREKQRGEALEGRLQIVRQRLEAKRTVVEDLMAERLTLLEAAAQFRDLSGESLDRPRQDPVVRANSVAAPSPDQSDEEWLCWKVLEYVEAEEKLNPGPTPVAPRLQTEFQERLQSGTLHFPW